MKFGIWVFFRKFVKNIHVLLKSDNNNSNNKQQQQRGTLHEVSPTYIYNNI